MTGEPHDTTIANADLWSKYFRDQWAGWLGAAPASPVAALAEGTGARVAGFLSLVAAGPIAWLYLTNEAKDAPPPAPDQRVEEPAAA